MKHLLNLSVFLYMAHKTIKISDAVCRIEKVTPLLNGYRITAECYDTKQAYVFEINGGQDPGFGAWIILSGKSKINVKDEPKPYYHISEGNTWTCLILNTFEFKKSNPAHSRLGIETATFIRSLNLHWKDKSPEELINSLRGLKFFESIISSEIQKRSPVSFIDSGSLLD